MPPKSITIVCSEKVCRRRPAVEGSGDGVLAAVFGRLAPAAQDRMPLAFRPAQPLERLDALLPGSGPVLCAERQLGGCTAWCTYYTYYI